MLNVGLLFHSSNSDNLGVGALTIGQIDIIRGISRATGIDISITLFDWVGPRRAYVERTDITIVPISGETMKDPRRIIGMFKKCDVMIDIGAGDSFADIYGSKRLNRMIYLKYLAHLARCPVVLAPQTFGPFTSWITRSFARDLIKRATLVSTRDDQSTAALRQLGVTRPVVTACDVALRLPTAGAPPVWGRPTVGINVSGLLMAGGYTGQNQFKLNMDYPSAMRALVGSFLTLPEGPNVVLVPHVISPAVPDEDDMDVSLALQREFPDVIVAPAFQSPSAAKAYIGSLDFFVGARMHSCIAAFSSGVPVVPLAYSAKFTGLFGSLGYDMTLDCCALEQDNLVGSVLSAYRNRKGLAPQVAVARQVGTQRLGDYVGALARVVSEAALKKRTDDQSRLATGHRWRAMDERL